MVILGSDIGPCSPAQAIFCIAIFIIGSILIAMLFGNISLLMMKLNSKNTIYQNKLSELEFKLKQRNIPPSLCNRVFEYFDFCWRKRKIFEQMSDFSELSIPLQKECMMFLHKDLITNVPLFCHLETNEIIRIIQKLKTEIYMPGDKIIREGEKGNDMYFLAEGVVEVLAKTKNKKQISIFLKKGSYFGEVKKNIKIFKFTNFPKIALISNSRRTSDVNSVEFSILESLNKVDYEILKFEFPG